MLLMTNPNRIKPVPATGRCVAIRPEFRSMYDISIQMSIFSVRDVVRGIASLAELCASETGDVAFGARIKADTDELMVVGE